MRFEEPAVLFGALHFEAVRAGADVLSMAVVTFARADRGWRRELELDG